MSETAIGGHVLPDNWLARIVLIWSGYAVSAFAGSAASYAAIWYVTESTQSSLALALVYVCAFLPMGLLSPFGGVLADKYDRKKIIISMDAILALSGFLLCAYVAFVGPSLASVCVFCGMYGITGGFRGPAYNSTMPLLVPQRHLMRINTLDGILSSLSLIAAPALGILLYSSLGLQSCMLISGFGCAAAAISMFLARVPRIESTSVQMGAWESLCEGGRSLKSAKGVLILLIAVSLGMMAYGPLDSLVPLMVSSHFGGDGYAASLVAAAMGVGLLLGSVSLMLVNPKSKLPLLICVAALIVGLMALLAGMLPSNAYVLFVVAVGVLGVFCSFFSAPLMTLIQTYIPENKLGRVMGLSTAVSGVAIPVGTALGGAAAELTGVPLFFCIDGVLIALLGVLSMLPKSVRALNVPILSAEAAVEASGE